MKTSFRILSVMLVVCLCAASLAGCGGGINRDEAKAFIGDFFVSVADGDFSKAEDFLHPDRPADLEAFFRNLEENSAIDFQSGIEIETFTGFSSSLYDSTVGGATLELSMRAKVGDKTVDIAVEIVKNKSGYGIYNLDLNA